MCAILSKLFRYLIDRFARRRKLLIQNIVNEHRKRVHFIQTGRECNKVSREKRARARELLGQMCQIEAEL